MTQRYTMLPAGALLFSVLAITDARAQQPARSPASAETAARPAAVAAVLPAGYVIGPQDVLNINFWKDPDMWSGDVVVRPDGKISLPLLNDIDAAGKTPEELRDVVFRAASRFIEDPNPTVTVKEINSRFVFITGNVAKPAAYALNSDVDVLKLISLAGGFLEYADTEKVLVLRTRNGRSEYFKFNYKEVIKQKNPQQNIVLKPGDQVVVP